jgi:hypothetical protein
MEFLRTGLWGSDEGAGYGSHQRKQNDLHTIPHACRSVEAMVTRLSTAPVFLFSLVVCVFLCVIATAEIPELVSLRDDASNDFTLHERASAESVVSSAAKQCAIQLFAETIGFAEVRTTTVEHTSVERPLFILNSVLRR